MNDTESHKSSEPRHFEDHLVSEMEDVPAGIRVVGFFLGAGSAFLVGWGFLFAGGKIADMAGSRTMWLGVVLAGPAYLAVAIMIGRWIWKAKNMKGMAVGLITVAALPLPPSLSKVVALSASSRPIATSVAPPNSRWRGGDSVYEG